MCAVATVIWLIFYNSSFCTRNICTVSSDHSRARIQGRPKVDVDNQTGIAFRGTQLITFLPSRGQMNTQLFGEYLNTIFISKNINM